MDCPICFEQITAQTGQVNLSCQHSFHYNCLTNWFYKQSDNRLPETCPCCRHEANEHEELPFYGVAEPSESESSESESDVEEAEPRDIETMASIERARAMFTRRENISSKEEFENYAATRIQAVWRSFHCRMSWYTYKTNIAEQESAMNAKKQLEELERGLVKKMALLKKSMMVPRTTLINSSATKIQSLWRRWSSHINILQEVIDSGIKINWVFTGKSWERKFLRWTETWDTHMGLSPQSLSFQNHRYCTRVQALWRGYRVRRVHRVDKGLVYKYNKGRIYTGQDSYDRYWRDYLRFNSSCRLTREMGELRYDSLPRDTVKGQ